MPIELLKVISGLRAMRSLVQRFEDMNTRQHEVDRDEEFRLWLAEVALAARELEARVGDVDARVLAVFDDREMQRVWRNIMFEATREAIDERRRMLAFAAVGAAASAERLTVAQIARVERTLRELDPQDLQVLAAVAAITAPAPLADGANAEQRESHHLAGRAHAERRHAWLAASPPSGDVLLGAGCIRFYSPVVVDSFDMVLITDIGDWVLAVADPYIRARGW